MDQSFNMHMQVLFNDGALTMTVPIYSLVGTRTRLTNVCISLFLTCFQVLAADLHSSFAEAEKLVRNGKIVALKKMIENRPRLVAETDKEGMTLLHHALLCNEIEISLLLIRDRRTDLRKLDGHGSSYVHLASSKDIIEVLAKNMYFAALCEVMNDRGFKPVHNLVVSCRQSVALRAFLKNGGDPNTLTRFGLSALHIAVRVGNLSGVRELISFDAEVNVIQIGLGTPLDIVERAISRGNRKDKDDFMKIRNLLLSAHATRCAKHFKLLGSERIPHFTLKQSPGPSAIKAFEKEMNAHNLRVEVNNQATSREVVTLTLSNCTAAEILIKICKIIKACLLVKDGKIVIYDCQTLTSSHRREIRDVPLLSKKSKRTIKPKNKENWGRAAEVDD